MAAMIEIPPENGRAHAKQGKSREPSRKLILAVTALLIALASYFGYDFSQTSTARDEVGTKAFSLADQIEMACANGGLDPIRYQALCVEATETKEVVNQVQGPQGPMGPGGPPGNDGEDGEAGTPGSPGTDGTDGTDGTNGADGQTIQGPKGDKGDKGEPGDDAELPTSYTKTYANGRTESCVLTPNTDPPNFDCTETIPQQ